GQVRFAALNDRALRDDRLQASSIFVIRDQTEPDVGVEHHHASVVLALHEVGERGRHRLEHHPEGPEMQRGHVGGQPGRHHVRREVRRRSAFDQELILREALAIDLRNGDRRLLMTDGRQLQARAVRDQQVRELAPEIIVGEVAEEGGRNPESGQRPRRVERTAAGCGALSAVAVADDVDQRLTADDDHADSPSGTGCLAPADSIQGTAASANTIPAPAEATNGIATPSAKSAPPTSDPTAVAVLSAVPTMPCASALRSATASRAGMTAAKPNPCTTRRTISHSMGSGMMNVIDATAATTRPPTSIAFAPMRPARNP